MVKDLYLLFHVHGSLFRELLKRQLFARYRTSVFGLVWSVVHPLFLLLIYMFVFREVFSVRWGTTGGESRAVFAVTLFCGMAFYTVFSEVMNFSTVVIYQNATMLKKAVFPAEIFPLVLTVSSAVTGLIWLLFVIGGNVYCQGVSAFCLSMLWFPLIYVSFLLFICGLSYFLSSLSVFFPDMQFMIGVFLNALFFTSPIFYPVSAVPDKFRWVLHWNPLTWFIEQGRNVLLNGTHPAPLTVCGLFLFGCLIFIPGYYWFRITKKGFADVL